jgi:hypothetical protein
MLNTRELLPTSKSTTRAAPEIAREKQFPVLGSFQKLQPNRREKKSGEGEWCFYSILSINAQP